MKRIKPFKNAEIKWNDGHLEKSVAIRQGVLGMLELTFGVVDPKPTRSTSWGCGWGGSLEAEDVAALKELLSKVEVEEVPE